MSETEKIQWLRGVTIFAVVCGHTLPEQSLGVYLRPIINASVAIFLFLSGYLTYMRIDGNFDQVFRKRIKRVLYPYIFWTIFIGAVILQKNLRKVLLSLFTLKYCPIYYYIIAHVQLTLLAPLVKRCIDKGSLLPSLLSLAYVIILGILECSGRRINFPLNCFSFFPWLIFYALGMSMRKGGPQQINKVKIWTWVLLYLLSLPLQLGEGLLWLRNENLPMAITQLKVTSMITSCLCCLMAWKWLASNTNNDSKFFAGDVFIALGNFSFAIYLIHIGIIFVMDKHFYWREFIPFPLTSVIVVALSFVIIKVANKYLPVKVNRFIGFS